MRIENLRKIKEDTIEKAVATVIYEDIDRAPADVYFYTSEAYSQFLNLNPDACLVAGYLTAIFVGEKRIWIDGQVDDQLKKGLVHNMKTFRQWYGRKYQILEIESNDKVFPIKKQNRLNSGLFFSGGVDSIYSLQNNRLKYQPDHPLYINDCLMIDGFDMNQSSESTNDQQIFKRALKGAQQITDEAKVNLIPVYTNLRHHFYGDDYFWGNWQHGSALAAIGHCFTSRLNSIFIASSHAPAMLEPWGSHPLIDRYHSSHDLTLIHDDLCSTFKKLELISTWETAFQNIRSCYLNNQTKLNCCTCEKCARIMVTLMALGILDKSQAFPIHQISPSLLKESILKHPKESHFDVNFLQLVPYLKKHGYLDIANLILKENRIKSKIQRFDKCYTQGKLKKIIR